ncbi:MAG: type II toxin-antitoxin system HicB family antitoxin [Gammaproteobacteria bacterium]|nr:type II toxin-antitoxin system HicB family antitoxin [Gammaproteobacteria bacterium]
MRYVAFIHHEAGTGYGISFPDFPGCVSIGRSVDEAVHQGCEALAFHFEGLLNNGDVVPSPRTIEDIKADDSLTEWRKDADIVLVPLLLDKGSSKRVNISIDPGLLDAIDEEAKARGMTRSAFLANAARHEIQST